MEHSNSKDKKIVVGLSGGMDSSTLLGYLLDMGYEVHVCTFKYGSKHNQYENEAAEEVIKYYHSHGFKITSHFFDLTDILGNLNSALLTSNEEDIPEGHYANDNMKRTVVPGRNLMFSSVMASLAESIGADLIALGVHAGSMLGCHTG